MFLATYHCCDILSVLLEMVRVDIVILPLPVLIVFYSLKTPRSNDETVRDQYKKLESIQKGKSKRSFKVPAVTMIYVCTMACSSCARPAALTNKHPVRARSVVRGRVYA